MARAMKGSFSRELALRIIGAGLLAQACGGDDASPVTAEAGFETDGSGAGGAAGSSGGAAGNSAGGPTDSGTGPAGSGGTTGSDGGSCRTNGDCPTGQACYAAGAVVSCGMGSGRCFDPASSNCSGCGCMKPSATPCNGVPGAMCLGGNVPAGCWFCFIPQ